MLEFSEFTPLFLILIACELSLGAYVMMNDCKSQTNRIFMQYIFLASMCGIMDLVLTGLDNEDEARLASRIWVFFLVLQMSAGYYLALMLPTDIRKEKGYAWVNAAIVLIIAACASLAVNDMTRSEFGWNPVITWQVATIPLGLTIFISLVLFTAIRRRRMLVGKEQKMQVTLITTALTLPADIILVIAFLRLIDIDMPRLFSIGYVATMLFISIGILRYNVFVPPRVSEQTILPKEPRTVDLKMSHAYLFEATSSDRMFNALLHEMGTGTSALIICRSNPDQLREKYHLAKTPIIWLAEIPGPDRIDPTNLQTLSRMATDFVGNGPSIVAIEGIEYLIINNDLNKVVKILGRMRDTIIDEGSILLVSLDPRALSPIQVAIFEREFELVDENVNERAETAI